MLAYILINLVIQPFIKTRESAQYYRLLQRVFLHMKMNMKAKLHLAILVHLKKDITDDDDGLINCRFDLAFYYYLVTYYTTCVGSVLQNRFGSRTAQIA